MGEEMERAIENSQESGRPAGGKRAELSEKELEKVSWGGERKLLEPPNPC